MPATAWRYRLALSVRLPSRKNEKKKKDARAGEQKRLLPVRPKNGKRKEKEKRHRHY